FFRHVVDVPVRVLAEVPPDDPVVLFLECPEPPLADVDAPSVGNQTKAYVERNRLGAHLEHVRERGGILGRIDSVCGEAIGAELERARGVEERYPSVFFSSRRRHTRCYRDWSSDVCSS